MTESRHKPVSSSSLVKFVGIYEEFLSLSLIKIKSLSYFRLSKSDKFVQIFDIDEHSKHSHKQILFNQQIEKLEENFTNLEIDWNQGNTEIFNNHEYVFRPAQLVSDFSPNKHKHLFRLGYGFPSIWRRLAVLVNRFRSELKSIWLFCSVHTFLVSRHMP
ncbi:hypothetical protein BpHYR1_042502 [Brachionus plicatilis]|uniref:Uncharacterized protein n=1 Tax=Brachionus plicatilis TaxID=10195 RepID=A0A3M7SWZ9_BRAPC|nr:hypothetical protein BpHYR1_042502 [Brachionus plicatilis]